MYGCDVYQGLGDVQGKKKVREEDQKDQEEWEWLNIQM